MKSILFQNFDKRAQEVSRYFLFLKNLEQGSILLSMGNANKIKTKPINNDLEKTIKATGYLLLYNLVEATMRNGIETIFDELKTQRVSFDAVREEIKKIIINHVRDKDVQSTDALLLGLQNISIDIISVTFDALVKKENKKRLFSGNVDAKEIRNTAKIYGFSSQTNHLKTRDGSDLLTIKTNRNDLAHGFKSFEEVGRNATANELLEIQKRVICYLRGILENIELYLSNEEYLKNNLEN
ncbi:MAE_28990/MAE_18760 family HEPN-like nuclease [Anabaena sp. CCY 9402-a]|uniref:MAE_28990/MAE_18760 family HEPN-like nuclease n=1 Tax=Anabaena sp. CCY 9402-a TaxID=3103867 RepID=UPI0039C6FA83